MFAITEEIAMGIVLLNIMYLAMDGAGQAFFGSCQILVLGHDSQEWRRSSSIWPLIFWRIFLRPRMVRISKSRMDQKQAPQDWPDILNGSQPCTLIFHFFGITVIIRRVSLTKF